LTEETAMTTATLTHLQPQQWRLLNGLWRMNHDRGTTIWHGLEHQLKRQNVPWEQLVALHAAEMVSVLADKFSPATAAELDAARKIGYATVHLLAAGNRLVENAPANQALLATGTWKKVRVRDVRRAAEVDNEVLFAMADDGLIEALVVDDVVPLSTFKRSLPDDICLRLTRKGRRYYPR
jgi:hypothetical protein